MYLSLGILSKMKFSGTFGHLSVVVAAIGLLLGMLLPSILTEAAAPSGYIETKLVASDTPDSIGFGQSVIIEGDTLLVGAPRDDQRGIDAGAVYMYRPDGLGAYTETKFVNSNSDPGDLFGSDVAMSGNTFVVGAERDSDNGTDSGSAYVYKINPSGYYSSTKLLASDGVAGDFYGHTVAISGDTIVVGAFHNPANGTRAGAVYVYEPDGVGGYTETKLIASDGDPADNFGISVAIAGDVIVVGDAIDDVNGYSQAGSAYVYEPDGVGGYTETKLIASDTTNYMQFGTDVAIAGDTIVIGRPRDNNGSGGGGSGAVYVYTDDGNGGYLEDKIVASDSVIGEYFGSSVAIHESTIVVGARWDDDNGTDSGSTYMYAPDGIGGYTESKFTASDGAPGNQYGFSVDVLGGTVIASALNSVYIYSTSPPPLDTVAPTLSTPNWSVNPKSTTETSTLTVPVTDNLAGIAEAEYFLGDTDPGEGNGATMQITNIQNGGLSADATTTFGTDFPVGVYKVSVRAIDSAGNWSAPVSDYLVVYDAVSGLKMTGRRTIIPSLPNGDNLPGLITTDQSDTAIFALSIKYDRNGQISGNSDFQFTYETGTNCKKTEQAVNCHSFELNASNIDWFIVQGANDSEGVFVGIAELTVDGQVQTVQFVARGLDGDRLNPEQLDKLELEVFDINANPLNDTPIYNLNYGEIEKGDIKIS